MTPPRTLRVEARGARPRTRRPTQTRPKGRTPRLRAHRPRAISARLCRSSPFVDPDPRVQAPRIPALCVEGLPERTIRGTPLRGGSARPPPAGRGRAATSSRGSTTSPPPHERASGGLLRPPSREHYHRHGTGYIAEDRERNRGQAIRPPAPTSPAPRSP